MRATKVVQDNEARAENLINLLPLLPSEEQILLLPEALTAARGIKREDYQAQALAKLITYLTSPQRRQVFDEIRLLIGLVTANWRMSTWEEVAESLPMPEREQFAQEEFDLYLKQKRGIPEIVIRFLPEGVKKEAIIVTLQLGTHNDVYSALLALPNDTLSDIWKESQLLHRLSSKNRRELLLALEQLAPVIYKLGGTEAISEVFHAIRDVRRWWP